MPKVKFNGKPAFDSNTMWGYIVEVTEEGTFGEVPDELLEIEVGAGRVQKIEGAKKPAAPVEVKKPEVVEKTVEVASEIVEEKPKAAEVVEGTGKRGPGRPKAE